MVIFEDYEDIPDGQTPPGWTGNVWASTNAAYSGSKSLRVNSDYLSKNYRTLPDGVKGIVIIDVWHRPKLGSDTNSAFMISDGTIMESLWHKNDQNKWWYHGIYFAEYDGTWTHFKAEVNTNTNQYSLWMNDNLIVSNFQLDGNYSAGIKRIHIHSGRGGRGTDSYFDNLSVIISGVAQGFATIVNFTANKITAQPGESIQFRVDIKNEGAVADEIFYRIIDINTGEIIASATWPSLGVGALGTVTPIRTMPNKTWRLRLEVGHVE